MGFHTYTSAFTYRGKGFLHLRENVLDFALGNHFPIHEHSLAEAGHVRRNEQPRLHPAQLQRPRHLEGDGPLKSACVVHHGLRQ